MVNDPYHGQWLVCPPDQIGDFDALYGKITMVGRDWVQIEWDKGVWNQKASKRNLRLTKRIRPMTPAEQVLYLGKYDTAL